LERFTFQQSVNNKSLTSPSLPPNKNSKSHRNPPNPSLDNDNNHVHVQPALEPDASLAENQDFIQFSFSDSFPTTNTNTNSSSSNQHQQPNHQQQQQHQQNTSLNQRETRDVDSEILMDLPRPIWVERDIHEYSQDLGIM
jgi:hypothetical protein